MGRRDCRASWARARAKELLLTGRIISAAEAERIGLVTEVVAPGRPRLRAHQLGEEIAERGPLAVREVKALVNHAFDWTLEEGHAAEVEASVRIFSTDDMLEGYHAFVGKPAHYNGR